MYTRWRMRAQEHTHIGAFTQRHTHIMTHTHPLTHAGWLRLCSCRWGAAWLWLKLWLELFIVKPMDSLLVWSYIQVFMFLNCSLR